MRMVPQFGLIAATIIGAAAAMFDISTHSDDGEKFTLLLLTLGGGIAGLSARRRWSHALLVGLWTPAAHVAVRLLGRADNVNPPTAASYLAMAVACVVAAGIGLAIGSLIRTSVDPALDQAQH